MILTDIINKAVAELDYSIEPRGLYEPIAYTLESGGKRLRPTLALIATDMYDGDIYQTLPAALALEIFHNFTLLHDDIMDNAYLRRGRETVHRKWDNNTAILSGDQMMIEAYKQLSNIKNQKQAQVLKWFNLMATQICEGQQYDVEMGNSEIDTATDEAVNQYIKMITYKTSVLLATALKIGAYLANAPEKDLENLYNFGINLGIAFQIQDDLLDTYGDPQTFGKAIGGDILEGKKTYLYINALKADKLNEAASLFAITDAEKKINDVRQWYSRLGIKKLTEKAIEDYSSKAIECLNMLSVSKDKILPLVQLTEKLRQRAD